MSTDNDTDIAEDAVQRMSRLSSIIPPIKPYSRERLVQELVLAMCRNPNGPVLNIGVVRGLLRLIQEAAKPDA